VQCELTTDCKSALAPVCNTDNNRCVECVVNSQCIAPLPACGKENLCVECTSDNECPTGQKCKDQHCE
jgi:hypothetical protein